MLADNVKDSSLRDAFITNIPNTLFILTADVVYTDISGQLGILLLTERNITLIKEWYSGIMCRVLYQQILKCWSTKLQLTNQQTVTRHTPPLFKFTNRLTMTAFPRIKEKTIEGAKTLAHVRTTEHNQSHK